ncbi:exonuclease domain-containing protein [Cognatishimia activa]|uniref:Exonuclease n=1 Tax=Cognatishimia activa TaxID=1715691 RepID=A0A975EM33_9RHOB|nr:exonuclease domain-containing protein [Cognatishimia activa]QTN34561.1 exonuclease [Cognatishimia activa]
MYRFIAVDVETANRGRHSICQIGLAYVSVSGDLRTESYLVDPEEPFSAFNIQLHGIGPDRVAGAPAFPEVLEALRHRLEESILVQHSTFDKQAFDMACHAYGIGPLSSEWINSVSVARRAWPEFKGNGGHGLANLKSELGLVFHHHDAEEDARAAAEVVLLAEERTGLDFLTLGRSKSQQKRA